MKRVTHHLHKQAIHAVKHIKKHKRTYLGGLFASFAVAKMVIVMAGVLGSASLFNNHASAYFEDPASICAGVTEIPETECQQLLNLYNSTNGDNWTITNSSHWGNTGSICGNRGGISCTDGHVTYIDLGAGNLSGSATLSGLEYLDNLRLNNNHLNYIDLEGMPRLRELWLYANQLTDIGHLTGLTNLQRAWIGGNPWTYLNFDGMTSMLILDITGSPLTGLGLSGLTNLNYLNLQSCKLATFPADILGITSLQSLYLKSNELTALPEELINLTSVYRFTISYNHINYRTQSSALNNFIDATLYGDSNRRTNQILPFTSCEYVDIPQAECEQLVNFYNDTDGSNRTNNTNWLQSGTICNNRRGIQCSNGHVSQINLDNNNLVGVATLSGLTSLATISLRYNQMTGISLVGLPALTSAHLEEGNLESTTLDGLDALPEITLNNNRLTNLSLSGFESIRTIYANNNKLTSIDLTNCNNLSYLDIQNNLLPNVPESFSELSDLNPNGGLFLSSNCRDVSSMSSGLVSFLNTKANTLTWQSSINGACSVSELCGNGTIDDGETCDDGNNNGNAGYCNRLCNGTAATYGCTDSGASNYSPSATVDDNSCSYASNCGDGHIADGEVCDDGANNGTPGYCSRSCDKILFTNTASIDPSFDTDVPVGFNAAVTAITVQTDGKILVGGDFTSYRGSLANHIVRLNADGTKDMSFTPGNGFSLYGSPAYGKVNTFAVQDDGKIIVGGDFASYSGVAVNKLVRLNKDGTRDTSFNFTYSLNTEVLSISLQSDGKILVASQYKLFRLNEDGSLDDSFTIGIPSGSRGADKIYTMAVQDDGKILLGGNFDAYNSEARRFIVRVNTDGSLDNTYANYGFNFSIRSIAIQDDGKVLVGGYGGTNTKNILRFNSNGTLDESFMVGDGFNNYVYKIDVQSDGRILALGTFTQYDGSSVNGAALLTTGGTLDQSLSALTGFGTFQYALARQKDEKLLICSIAGALIRLTTNRTVDESFSHGNGFDNYISSTVTQADGKVLIGGGFTMYKGQPAGHLIRLNANGTRDTSFDIGRGFTNTSLDTAYVSVNAIALQDDGKILVGGKFTTYDGESASHLIRLNEDGTRDTSFVSYGFSSDWDVIYSIIQQDDGKILVGGVFSVYSGTVARTIVRLNADGTKDDSFNSDGFYSSNSPAVFALALQDDGKILVGGQFSNFGTWAGASANNITRLNTDGTRDTSFSIGNGFDNYVYAFNILSNGKILVGGAFNHYKSVTAYGIVRINSNGTRDYSFNPGTNFGGTTYTIGVQSDGKILIGGQINIYDEWYNATRVGILRLNVNGTKDTTFVVGHGFDNDVNTINIQSGGKILVGGAFTNYNGVVAGYLTTLYGDSDLVVLPNTTDKAAVINEFTNKGYVESDGDLIGSKSISLIATDGSIPVDLNLKNNNIQLDIPANIQFKEENNVTNYDGIISVPKGKNITTLNDAEVLASFKVGSSSESIKLTGGVASLVTPVPDTDIGTPVQVYYSEDNGVTWYPQTVVRVTEKNGASVAEFTTTHFTDFAVTLWSGDYTGSFVINNDVLSTYMRTVTLHSTTTPPALQMRFSNDNDTRSDWETYTGTKDWTLSEGSGDKTVYAEFDFNNDSVADVSVSDSILLTDPTYGCMDTGANNYNQEANMDDASCTYTCGNGITNPGETCDDGQDNGTYGYCNATCDAMTEAICGNGATEGTEVCDNGENNGTYGYCNATCDAMGDYCGDGTVNGSETCDNGSNNGTPGMCNTTCDGTEPDLPPEDVRGCTDPNANNYMPEATIDDASCTYTCGNGITNPGETCDDGQDNGTPGMCNATCDGTEPAASMCSDIPQSECDALVNLYNSTNGDNRTYKTNWLQTGAVCGGTWYGVACADGHVSEIVLQNNNLSGTANLSGLNDLYGLDFFGNQLTDISLATNTALGWLILSSNQLSSINLSHNTVLTQLALGWNQLHSIDLSHNTALNNLDIQWNQLGDIDLSNNTALNILGLAHNHLTGIDLSQNTALTILSLNNNQLTSIDLTNNTGLTQLILNNNLFTGIDLSNNTALNILYLSRNQISSIDLSNNSALFTLDFGGNQLTGIDLSNNTALTTLYLSTNFFTTLPESTLQLTELGALTLDANCRDIQSMSNDLLNFLDTKVGNSNWHSSLNPACPGVCGDAIVGSGETCDDGQNNGTYGYCNATCDGQYTPTCGDGIVESPETCDDNNTSDGDGCSSSCQIEAGPFTSCANTDIPQAECEALVNLYNNNNGMAWSQQSNWMQSNIICSNWYGVSCTQGHVTSIQLTWNNIAGAVDISGLSYVYYLDFYGNSISSINLAGLTSLETLSIANNQLSSIDLSGLVSLHNVYLDQNNLSSIDFAGLTGLERLMLGGNSFSTIDLSGLSNLTYFSMVNGQLSTIDLSPSPLLGEIDLSNNNLSTIDISSLTGLFAVNLTNNHLSTLDLNGLNTLQQLWVGENNLSTIDLSQATSLQSLSLTNNQFSSIDLAGLTNLQSLSLENNQLTTINLAGLTNISQINLSNNNLSTIDITGLSGLSSLYLSNNRLSGSLDMFCPFTSLQGLVIDHNRFAGDIPSCLKDNLTNMSWGSINYNYLNTGSATNPDLVAFLNNYFDSSPQGWIMQYLPADLALEGNIISQTGTTFVLNLGYHNYGPQTATSGTLYYSLIDGLTIQTDATYTTGTINKTYGGFGDPCFDQLYASGSGGYRDLMDIYAQGEKYDNFLAMLTEQAGYTGDQAGAGKFVIDLVNNGKEGPITDRYTYFLQNFGKQGIDLATVPGCGTGGTSVYIFDLGSIESESGGTIVISGEFTEQLASNGRESAFEITSPLTMRADPITGNNILPLTYSKGVLQAGYICGNGITEGLEECDDGNTTDNDSCSNSCQIQFSCADVTDVTTSECEALVNVYNTNNGVNWNLQTNWKQSNTICNNWYGVSCTAENEHVIQIYLSSNNLVGSIQLSGLSYLQYVYLSSNQLTGIDLSGLSGLQYIDISTNQFTSVDLHGLVNLGSLNLDNNQLTSINLTGLVNLYTLSLGSNQLTSIDLSGLTNLQSLDLGYNQFNSVDLSGLVNLRSLGLYNNQLTTIDLNGLTNLQTLNVGYNQLNSINLDGLANLQYLVLDNNQLTSLPDSLLYLTNLYDGGGLNITYNHINYYHFSQPLLDFIDSKRNGDRRLTQTFTNDYNCGNSICESDGYCALDQTGSIGCSYLDKNGLTCTNGCTEEVTPGTCGGKFSCKSISDEIACSQYGCLRSGGACGKPVIAPLSCDAYTPESCPTNYGCSVSVPLTNCTGTFDESSITQEQCGTVYSGSWMTEDYTSCPVDCLEDTGGQLTSIANGTGFFDGILLSKSANTTGVVSGDIINYTLHYENNSASNDDFIVSINDYLPSNLHFLSGSDGWRYVDHDVTYGGENDVCFQQFLQSTGAYYDLINTTILGAFGVDAYQALVANFGYAGDESGVGQFFYDNMCLGQADATNLQDCFNRTLNFNNSPQYSYPQLAMAGSGCGEIGKLLERPYYTRYLGYVFTGQSGDIYLSAQVDDTWTGGTTFINQGDYFVGKIDDHKQGTKDIFSGFSVSLRTLAIPTLATTGGQLVSTVYGTGNFDGTLFSKSANTTGVVSGDIINYTLHYENNSAVSGHYGVMIREYLPSGLEVLPNLSGRTYVDHDVTYGGPEDVCFQQFMQSTGAYYDFANEFSQRAFGADLYTVLQNMPKLGFTGSESDVGAFFYNSICVDKNDATDLQDCFNKVGTVPNDPQYSFPQLISVGSGCGTVGKLLKYPYYYHYVGYVGTGQSGDVHFSAQVNGSQATGLLQNTAEYFPAIIMDTDYETYQNLVKPTEGLQVTLNTEMTQISDLAVTKTLLTTGAYLPGAELQYRIDYANIGNINLTDVRIYDAALGLSLIGANKTFTGAWDGKEYGITGDVCYADWLNETGVYFHAMDESINAMYQQQSGQRKNRGYTGATMNLYQLYLVHPGLTGYYDAPWNHQLNMLSEYILSIRPTYYPGQTLVEAFSGGMLVDITTLDPSCGTGGTYYDYTDIGDLAVGESGSIIVTMRVDSGYQIGDSVANFAYGRSTEDQTTTGNNLSVVYTTLQEGVTATTGAIILTGDHNAKAKISTGTNIIVNNNVWNEKLPTVSYATSYKGMSAGTTVQGVTSLSFEGNAIFDKTIEVDIPVSSGSLKYYVKADHNDGNGLTFNGLTTNPDATCSGGLVTSTKDIYDGELVSPIDDEVIIYSCAASSFIAYTIDTPNNEGTGNNGGNGGGGGGGIALEKDICKPADCSASYYDRNCGGCPGDALANFLILTTHGVAPAEGMQCMQYSDELNSAYTFAFENNITTIADCDKVNLNGELLRSHMAKMMSNFAMTTLGLKPNTGTVCTFTDMSKQSDEMKTYATLACQLGLMGLDTNGKVSKTFNPDATVTRAQFGTVLSRLIRGDKNNDSTPYYAKHLSALKNVGIMTKIEKPNQTELRGFTMLMLQRIMSKAASTINSADKDKPIRQSVQAYFNK